LGENDYKRLGKLLVRKNSKSKVNVKERRSKGGGDKAEGIALEVSTEPAGKRGTEGGGTLEIGEN